MICSLELENYEKFSLLFYYIEKLEIYVFFNCYFDLFFIFSGDGFLLKYMVIQRYLRWCFIYVVIRSKLDLCFLKFYFLKYVIYYKNIKIKIRSCSFFVMILVY